MMILGHLQFFMNCERFGCPYPIPGPRASPWASYEHVCMVIGVYVCIQKLVYAYKHMVVSRAFSLHWKWLCIQGRTRRLLLLMVIDRLAPPPYMHCKSLYNNTFLHF